ncbi:MAG: helix-turn-helix domain-containing protein [Micropepsaceae bacterium]
MSQPVSSLAQIAPRGLSTSHPLLETLACLSCPARKSDICGSMSDADIKMVASSSSRIRLKTGDTLVWDGDEARHAYVVTQGTLRASKANDDGRRQVLSFMFVGQFIGIPSDHMHHHSVEALTDSEVCRFERRKLEELLQKYPAVDKGYRTGTARQLENAHEHAFALGRRTAMERVAAFLLELSTSGCPKTSSRTLKLPMTRNDIADFLGLTLETVSRAFSRLKSVGAIALPSAQEVEIKDEERLKALAGLMTL